MLFLSMRSWKRAEILHRYSQWHIATNLLNKLCLETKSLIMKIDLKYNNFWDTEFSTVIFWQHKGKLSVTLFFSLNKFHDEAILCNTPSVFCRLYVVRHFLQLYNFCPKPCDTFPGGQMEKILTTSQPGPCAAQEKFDELTPPIWIFYVAQSFLFHLDFGVWGIPGSRGWVGRVMLVLRTFPELVGRSVQNWSCGSGVKRGHRYKQSVLYI